MAQVSPIKTSFLLGEMSQRCSGQTDTPQYAHGLKKLENATVTPLGGVKKRPGTQSQLGYTVTNFVLESSSTTLATAVDFKTLYARTLKAIPFNTSDGKRWIILLTSGAPTEWSVYDVNSGILRTLPTYAGVNRTNGFASTGGTLGRGHVTDAFWTSTISNGVRNYQYTQAGDVLFITSLNGVTLTIRYARTKHFDLTDTNNYYHPVIAGYDTAFMLDATFASTNTEKHQNIPWNEPNVNDNYGNGALTYTWAGYPAAPTYGTTLVTITASKTIFSQSWIGSTNAADQTPGTVIRLNDIAGLKSVAIRLIQYVNSTTVKGVFIDGDYNASTALSYGTAANTSWEESAWSYKNGFPTAVAYFGSRVLYGGTLANPNRVWNSAVGDADELATTRYCQDSDYSTYPSDTSRAFYFDIAGCNAIKWMVAGKNGVFIGGGNAEFNVSAPKDTYSYADYKVEVGTAFGSIQAQAVKISSEAFFIARSGTRMRDMVFSFQEDDYKSNDMSEFAEHIARQSISNISELYQMDPQFCCMAMQSSADPVIWAMDMKGGLSSASMSPRNGTFGWARHKFGGTPIGGQYGITNPIVATMCLLPAASGPSDELWIFVLRKVNSANIVSLEYIGPYFDGESYTHTGFNPNNGYAYALNKRAVFLDCCKASFQASAQTTHTFSGLNNETVSVVADGSYLGEVTLNGSGQLTLAIAAKEVLVGYLYDTYLTTLDLELLAGQGNSQAKFKNLYEVWLRFYKTGFCQVKSSSQSAWQTMKFVTDATPSDGPVTLFTGDNRANIGNIERNTFLEIKHRAPFPFELLALILKAEVS